MASQFVRKITDTTTSEPIKETTTSGDFIITKDDKVFINLNGVLKDLTPAFNSDEFNELKEAVNKNADDIKKNAEDVVHNTGNETVAGTKTFTDGVSLSGKSKVNGVTDTDWQDISLNEGYGGSIKYRYSMGALYLVINDLTGIKVGGGDKSVGKIPNYTNSLRNIFSLIIGGKGVVTGTISTEGIIYISSANNVTLTDSDKGYGSTVIL